MDNTKRPALSRTLDALLANTEISYLSHQAAAWLSSAGASAAAWSGTAWALSSGVAGVLARRALVGVVSPVILGSAAASWAASA